MSEVEQLSCEELVQLVTAYFECALSREERRRFDRHLELCEGCRIFVDQLSRTIELAGRIRVEDVPPEAADALLMAFRDWKSNTA